MADKRELEGIAVEILYQMYWTCEECIERFTPKELWGYKISQHISDDRVFSYYHTDCAPKGSRAFPPPSKKKMTPEEIGRELNKMGEKCIKTGL